MFDSLKSDWFNITLEVVFVALIWFDLKKYLQTKKREYLINIIATIGFAIWALYPYYMRYFEWSEDEKKALLSHCDKEKNATLCRCLDKTIFENYTFKEYKKVKDSTEFQTFLKDTKEECNDDGWF